jgi:lipoate---protein ligase
MYARWLDLGDLQPLALHATCEGLAEAMAPGSDPVVVWARPTRAHVSVGASQSVAAELDLEACRASGVEIVRRPLGGGTVFVDEDQYCFFFILPRARVPADRQALLDACLAPACATLRGLGLPAERVGRGDLWLRGRKILGSGAATIGQAHAVGASFLLRFPIERFASLLRCPSRGFRQWLVEELEAGMTDWAAHAALPRADALARTFREAIERGTGWALCEDRPTASEEAAIAAAAEELSMPDLEGGRRQVEGGVKVNHHVYLLERASGGEWLRVVLREGRVGRIAAADATTTRALQACRDVPLDASTVRERLRPQLGTETDRWVARLLALAADWRNAHG